MLEGYSKGYFDFKYPHGDLSRLREIFLFEVMEIEKIREYWKAKTLALSSMSSFLDNGLKNMYDSLHNFEEFLFPWKFYNSYKKDEPSEQSATEEESLTEERKAAAEKFLQMEKAGLLNA